MPDEENDFLARARIPPRGAAEDYQVLQDMSEGNTPPDPRWTGRGCGHLHILPGTRSQIPTGAGLKELMAKPEPVSHSQLLLPSPLAVVIPEARGAGGDREC